MASDQTSGSSKEERIQRLLRQYEQALRKSFNQPFQTLEEIEREIGEIGKQAQEELQREKIEEAGSGYVGTRLRCACGQQARYRALASRQLTTLHGRLHLQRAYYYCPGCRQGQCPLDRVLGLSSGELSLGVQGVVARLTAYLPFRQAVSEVQMSFGVRLCHGTAQRVAQTVGDQLRRDWKARQALLVAERLPSPNRGVSGLHASLDGVMVHVGGQWKEAKVGVSYQHRPGEGVEQAAYYATLATSAEFGPRWRTLVYANGAGKTPTLVVVADGAEWIWQEVGKSFPRSVQILDYYHAAQHLWSVAHARFGEGNASGRAWMELQQERLLTDRVGQVVADVGEWCPCSEAGREVKRRELGYLTTHQHRMRYQTFRAAGYHIGSGVVESSCKSTVQWRMKGPGMRWQEEGAEAMLHLRAAWCSSQDTDFQAIARRAAVAA